MSLWRDYTTLHQKNPNPGSLPKVDYYDANSGRIKDVNNGEKRGGAVVIIAHNEEEYLPRALASINVALGVIEQGERPRVVVVDNASTDATGDIARAFGAELVFEPKKGIGQARQTGLEATHSFEQIIYTTDADVMVNPEWLHVFSSALLNSELVGGYGLIKAEFDAPISLGTKLQRGVVKSGGAIVKTIRRVKKTPPCPGSANMAFLRDSAIEVGGYDSGLLGGEDADLVNRLRTVGRVGLVDVSVVHSRRREEGEGLLVNAFRVGVDELLRAMKLPGWSDLQKVYSQDHRWWC